MKRRWFDNNDIPMIILCRLHAKTLHCLKYVAKEWFNLISDRSFISSQLKKTEPISGFFFQEVFQWTDNEGMESISYIPIDVEKVNLWCNVLDFLPERVIILSLNNGLLCCRSCFPSSDARIYVCNPLNKQWTSFEWHYISQNSNIALVFDPFKNPIDESTCFKLVSVTHFEKEADEYCFCFDIYLPERGVWRRSEECCWCNHSIIKNKDVLVDGILYWLTDGYQILMFDPQNELSWLVTTPLPPTEFSSIPEMCIGESQGKLCYVIISENGFQLWVLEDHFASQWELKVSKSLDTFESENSDVLYRLSEKVASRWCKETPAWLDPLAFKDGMLLLRVSATVYLYRFDTGKMKKLCDVSSLGPTSMYSPIVVPYAMSLVPLDQTLDYFIC